MVLSWARLKKSGRHFPAVLKQYFFVFLGMHAINLFFNQSMIYLQELRMSSRDDVYVPVMLVVAFLGFIVQAVIKVIWTFIICHHFTSKAALGDYLRSHLEQGLIESLRAFFKAVLWGFVFIIPGFHKIIQYQLVLYTVGLDPDYERGRVDAVAESVRLSKRHNFALGIMLLIFGILSIMTTTGHFLFKNPVPVLTMEGISFLLMTLETIYVLFLYQDLRQEKGPAPTATVEAA